MEPLDFKLRYLQRKATLNEVDLHLMLGSVEDPTVFDGLGFQMTSTSDHVAAGLIAGHRLEQLMARPDLNVVEATPTPTDAADINHIAINLLDPKTYQRVIPSHGRGAIIGVIDSGFDLTQPCFFDPQKNTRILAAWDQVNLAQADGKPPDGFAYGVEHTQAMINQYVADQQIFVVKNADNAEAHGTAVTGIAAGNGTADGLHEGIAPEAELILVAYRNDVPIGGSPYVIDALRYILEKARYYQKPVVINISQGDSLGAHDGTSALERAIDNLIEQEGVPVVCSAGNARGGQRHAAGQVSTEQSHSLIFNLRTADGRAVDGDAIELWYGREDRFAVALKSPEGAESPLVHPDTEETVTFPSGAKARVRSETNNADNSDNRISVTLEKGEGWTVGPWELILSGNEITHGSFHAWTDRPNASSVISFQQPSDSHTVTLPATSRQIIAVSGFIAQPPEGAGNAHVRGALQPLTSLGQTRDGRVKPNLTAPGFVVIAPETHVVSGDNPLGYFPRMGTSMAAPHVSGVIALLLSLMPGLKAGAIRDALFSTAGADSFTGNIPNTSWGQGKLNAGAAYQALSKTLKSGGTIMNGNEQVTEMNLAVTRAEAGKTTNIAVTFQVMDNNIISIKGLCDGKEYTGTLSFELDASDSMAEGGDQCIICNPECIEVTPCPNSRPRPGE